MNNVTFRRTGSTVSGQHEPSPEIWADCPVKDLLERPELGRYFYDNFLDFPLIPTITTQVGVGKYKAYNTGSGTFQGVTSINSAEVLGGALQVDLDTDNDSGSIAQAYPQFRMSGLPATDGKLWFECCYCQSSVVTNLASVFFGLAETEQFTLAATVPLNASDSTNNSGSMIGFRIEEDGLGVVDTVVSDRATSFTNIGDTEAGTMTAFTFAKYGMVYDPTRSTDCVRFYVNNVQTTTSISKSTLIAYTNLDANALGFLWASCADSAGTTFKGFMKWVRIAQLNPGYTP